MKTKVPPESLEKPATQLIMLASEDGDLQALAMQLSIAMSAKRIADALDQIVAILDQVSDGNSYAAINTRSTT